MNTFIRLLYAILIAAAVITFVSVSVNTFYPSPDVPQPVMASPTNKIGEPSSLDENTYNQAYAQYQKDLKAYDLNFSIILVTLGALIIVGGLLIQKRLDIIGEGLSLGGIGTSIYSIGAAVATDNRLMRFIAVTVFLGGTLVIVYFKFNKIPASKRRVTKKA